MPVASEVSPFLLALLVLYCVVGAATVVFDSAGLLHNRWENMYPEASQTYAAIYAAQTGKLYLPPLSQPPYTPQPFTPLYYASDAYLAKMAHLDIDLFTFYARSTEYIAYLLCGLMVFMISEAAEAPLLYATLAALMLLGHPDFLGQNATPRPDMLYLLAMLISLYCAVKCNRRIWIGYGLVGGFAGIAFLIKQPGLAAALSIFVVLLLEKDFKPIAALAVGTFLPVAITFLILYWRQDPFFQHLLFTGKSLWSLKSGVQYVSSQLLVARWLVPIVIGAMGFVNALNLGTKAKMIASFALINWLIGLAGICQIGGSLNYFLPGLAGCALLLPYAIRLFRERLTMKISAVIACAALLWATTNALSYEAMRVKYFPAPTTDSLVWLHPYRILSDLSTLTMHGREPMLLDPYTAHMMELTGNWNPTPFLQSLSRADFDLIIFKFVGFDHLIPAYRGVSVFGPEEVGIMNEKYRILCSTDRSTVLMPRGREVSATPEMFTQMFQERCDTELRATPMDFRIEPGAR